MCKIDLNLANKCKTKKLRTKKNMNLDNTELYNLVLKLTERVNRLEKMISFNPIIDIPSINLSDWVLNCMVTIEDVEMVYENNGFMSAIKNCIKRNHTISRFPITIFKNVMYVFDSNNWEKWDATTHLYAVVRDIWRKFIKLHMETTILDDEMHDIHRKLIIEMRHKLYDIKKNRMELCKWLMKIDS